MNNNREIEKIYMEYLLKANEVFQTQRKVYAPYAVSAIVLLGIGGSAFIWAPPKSALWLFISGFVMGFADVAAGTFTSVKKVFEKAAEVDRSLPGFGEFFKLFHDQRWWPKQMVAGEKYEQFLSIIGRN